MRREVFGSVKPAMIAVGPDLPVIEAKLVRQKGLCTSNERRI